MSRPVIGITLDVEEKGLDKYSKHHNWYALRENYSAAIAKHGAIPIFLPHHAELSGNYLDLIDGIIVSGGDFDIDPAMYGDEEVHPTVTMKKRRSEFEYSIIRGAIENDIPTLAICGGEQMLAVALGGTLIQHIPDEVKNAIEHEAKTPPTQNAHEIIVTEGTKLEKIFGTKSLNVNSTHHQSVKDSGPDLLVSAVAPDGVIEAIEHPKHRFCIGVQWHPEYENNEEETKLFSEFVKACEK